MKHFFAMRLFKAVGIFLLGSAIIHIILLFIHALLTMNFSIFNFFGILNFDLFYPNIARGPVSFAVSAILIVGLVTGIFFIIPKKRKASVK